MKRILFIMAAALALAFIPAVIYAQGMGGQSPDNLTMGLFEAKETAEISPVFRASKVIGTAVQNYQEEYLGVIRDVMVDPQNGGTTFAILSRGGVLGIPMKFAAVPFSAFAFNPEKEIFFLDMSREQMASAPGFDRGQWPQHADRSWETDVYRYFGQTPAWEESSETMAESQGPTYRFTAIRGTSVRSPGGEKLAEFRDMMIDFGGNVPLAVLSHGGFLGMKAKLVAVPLSDLSFDTASHSFFLNETKEKLDEMPAFHESQLTDSEWAERIYRSSATYPIE
jgi:uncharacterized protein YrrD